MKNGTLILIFLLPLGNSRGLIWADQGSMDFYLKRLNSVTSGEVLQAFPQRIDRLYKLREACRWELQSGHLPLSCFSYIGALDRVTRIQRQRLAKSIARLNEICKKSGVFAPGTGVLPEAMGGLSAAPACLRSARKIIEIEHYKHPDREFRDIF